MVLADYLMAHFFKTSTHENYPLFTIVFTTLHNAIGQVQRENLMIVWPEEYKWKVGSNKESESVHMMELIPGNEDLQKWTIIQCTLLIPNSQCLIPYP